MSDLRAALREFIEERPELKPALQHLLAVEREHGSWTFDDTECDSGTFGEIVSREFVEEVEEGYRFANQQLVNAELNDEKTREISENTPLLPELNLHFSPDAQRRVGILLLGLGMVAAIRVIFMYGATFREGDIVLSGNDPYLYRFWVEQLLKGPESAFTVEGIKAQSLPGNVAVHDVLMIIAGWWFAALLGGGPKGAGLALAIYPPLCGVLTVALVYKMTTIVYEERATGLAAVGVLAITPVHVFRTALGFGDHHALDFLVVALTATGLVLLSATTHRAGDYRFSQIKGALTLGTGVAGTALVWRAGPLFHFPIALYIFLRVLSDVRAGRSPIAHTASVLGGLVIGTLLTFAVHFGLGWVEPFRGFAPLLLLSGALLTTAIGEIVYRFNGSATLAAVGNLLAVGGGTIAAWRIVPDVPRATLQFVEYMTGTTGSGIAETTSIFSSELGTLFGPFFLFGLFFFLGLPYLGWATFQWWRDQRPIALPLVAFGWYFLLLAIVQLRFSGSLSLFMAIFAGIGFRHLLSVVELGPRPAVFGEGAEHGEGPEVTILASVNDRQTVLSLVLIVVVVAGPALGLSLIKMEQIDVDEPTYGAATAIERYSTTTETPPPAYVLSSWSDNRIYNYFLDGESRSYGYARGNYPTFLTDTDPQAWVNTSEKEIGYVVITDSENDFDSRTTYSRLFTSLGSRNGDVPGLGGFRTIYISNDGSTKAFAVDEGYRLTGHAEPDTTLPVSKQVTVSEQSFSYKRQVTTNATGAYSLRVPYPGKYRVGNSTAVTTD